MKLLIVITAYAAAVTALYGIAIAVICLQWRRIGRLGQRVHQQRDAAMNQTLKIEELEKANTGLRDENVRLLRLSVEGTAP